MRIAIIADLHANLEATTAVLDEIGRRGADRILCLGDVVGYNAQPNDVVDLVRDRDIPNIMGNHDAAACGVTPPHFFRDAAKKVIEWQLECIRPDNREWLARSPDEIVFGRTFLAVHGSPNSRDDYIIDWLDAMRQLELLNGRPITVCFFGHSHRPSFFGEKGTPEEPKPGDVVTLRPMNRYFINPGAVGQPRDHDPRAAFGLFDSEKMTFEFCRVEYDIESCANKIKAEGLPSELARRLRKGK